MASVGFLGFNKRDAALKIMRITLKIEEPIFSEVLRDFFAMSPSQVRKDLEKLRNFDGRKEALRELEKILTREGYRTSGEMVDSFHRRLLLAAAMNRTSKLPDDLLLFSATVTAHEIAEMSCSAATGTGVLGVLAEVFECRDYLDGSAQKNAEVTFSDQMLNRINDSVFLEVLSRYGLERYGEIFERNRALYDIRWEVGRLLVSGISNDQQDHFATVARLRELYGPKAVHEFLSRLKKHDLLPC